MATFAKVLVIGDQCTGKTSLIRRYVYKSFSDLHQTTLGVDYSLKKVKVQNRPMHIQLWDIAGQERFISMARAYYQNACAAIVCFDVSSKKSLESAVMWKRDVDEKVRNADNTTIPVVLVANKYDLVVDGHITDAPGKDELDAFIQEHGFAGWFATSAKTGDNVKACFHFLIAKIAEERDRLESAGAAEMSNKSDGRITANDLADQKTSGSEDTSCCG